MEEAINKWSTLLKEYSGNSNAWNFFISNSTGYLDTVDPEQGRDIIMEVVGGSKVGLACGLYGQADIHVADPSSNLKGFVVSSCVEEYGETIELPMETVYSSTLHEFAHTLGLGHAFNIDYDLMCSSDVDIQYKEIITCESYEGEEREEPSEADVMALLYKYGIDGFVPPNRELVDFRLIYQVGTPIDGLGIIPQTQTQIQ